VGDGMEGAAHPVSPLGGKKLGKLSLDQDNYNIKNYGRGREKGEGQRRERLQMRRRAQSDVTAHCGPRDNNGPGWPSFHPQAVENAEGFWFQETVFSAALPYHLGRVSTPPYCLCASGMGCHKRDPQPTVSVGPCEFTMTQVSAVAGLFQRASDPGGDQDFPIRRDDVKGRIVSLSDQGLPGVCPISSLSLGSWRTTAKSTPWATLCFHPVLPLCWLEPRVGRVWKSQWPGQLYPDLGESKNDIWGVCAGSTGPAPIGYPGCEGPCRARTSPLLRSPSPKSGTRGAQCYRAGGLDSRHSSFVRSFIHSLNKYLLIARIVPGTEDAAVQHPYPRGAFLLVGEN
jgi:hypothetical protein